MSEVTMQTPPADSLLPDLLKGAGAFVMGALGAVAVFGARLKINENKLADHSKAIDEKLEQHKMAIEKDLESQERALSASHNGLTAQVLKTEREFRESLDRLGRENGVRHEENVRTLALLRRQVFMGLRMTADLARHTGADKRFDDEIWRMISEGKDQGRE